MGAKEVVELFQDQENWNDKTVLDLLLRFLDDQSESSTEIEVSLTEYLDNCTESALWIK